ncbi:katanin p60 ATPase-containing subunit A-like 2 [Plectropomus leopardus]|uniref:katanin p60 ATPase-containing subunit A-like 2 n=1 Tax=Plectropomus leopardus TaxID=160734 RepID=UPI001C4BA150|nr:katanin p60 ATPase-containing subunit A-like 2 [Plectropomus leopardus]XP_042364969.1 katanin p60 ATPase-containing subunit A-like 2 [Plectropomus leopardus]
MRKKSPLSSIYCHLLGYIAAAVDQETYGGVGRFKVCDNVSLEYKSYHYVKFERYPKLIRRMEKQEMQEVVGKESLFRKRRQEDSCQFTYKCIAINEEQPR